METFDYDKYFKEKELVQKMANGEWLLRNPEGLLVFDNQEFNSLNEVYAYELNNVKLQLQGRTKTRDTWVKDRIKQLRAEGR